MSKTCHKELSNNVKVTSFRKFRRLGSEGFKHCENHQMSEKVSTNFFLKKQIRKSLKSFSEKHVKTVFKERSQVSQFFFLKK